MNIGKYAAFVRRDDDPENIDMYFTTDDKPTEESRLDLEDHLRLSMDLGLVGVEFSVHIANDEQYAAIVKHIQAGHTTNHSTIYTGEDENEYLDRTRKN